MYVFSSYVLKFSVLLLARYYFLLKFLDTILFTFVCVVLLTCTYVHLSCRPWYMSMLRTQPLEMVLVIDLMDFRESDANIGALRSAALAVLNSLTRQDKVNSISICSRGL